MRPVRPPTSCGFMKPSIKASFGEPITKNATGASKALAARVGEGLVKGNDAEDVAHRGLGGPVSHRWRVRKLPQAGGAGARRPSRRPGGRRNRRGGGPAAGANLPAGVLIQ